MTVMPEPVKSELFALLHRIVVDVLKGIRHGHFDYRITCHGNDKNGNRQVDFNAGLSHRYNLHRRDIPPDTIPQVTFQPKAPFQHAQTLETSPPDAQVQTDTRQYNSSLCSEGYPYRF